MANRWVAFNKPIEIRDVGQKIAEIFEMLLQEQTKNTSKI